MINRLPQWFRQDLPAAEVLSRTEQFRRRQINTVCQEAHCPNLARCWQKNHFTFMILGSSCSRNCRFCSVDKSCNISGVVDAQEPQRIAEAVRELGLDFTVITSVTRDDLPDGGANQFVKTIEAIRLSSPATKIEVLIPDFQGNLEALKAVVQVRPEIIAHNLETISRLYLEVRPQADYSRSLNILRQIKESEPQILTKSSLLLGMGEKEEEVTMAIKDLVAAGCDILTLGQYLAPSPRHYPVKEFIDFKQFAHYGDLALESGIKSVLSGPLVRSSYQAEEAYEALCTT